jgi:hypothetical protein
MKPTEFKKIIKDAVKEAFQEELKDILLEAVRSPKSPISEARFIEQPLQRTSPKIDPTELRASYTQILNETSENMSFSPQKSPAIPYRPAAVDMVNGALPPGDISIDQIAGLLTKR